MSETERDLQAFLFRAMATNRHLGIDVAAGAVTIEGRSSIEQFSEEARTQAESMGRVYELLYCLENSIRELVEATLREAFGVDKWWTNGVDLAIRKIAEKRQVDDHKARWHGPRGESLLAYVDFPQYGDIIVGQWQHFEPLLGDQAWVNYYFEELNRTRRALAHTGTLTDADVERMEIRVRDWLRVVG
ncbi:Swt1 family HEPN domain-containing protein [Cellulomonas rhizosphaerae]|uniref:Swt1-like HEPN domain-containing protein n=1 Tax=Cellulomonas rhizosphaerae TaxID=2293719 RepID=A0A413RJU8_9CELL|nr:Swt1 family HEPN domain-containing protein [Cellulomonas rhizosphaerae]RHA39001.1 hypothetical protein D1825_12690 [Cellulomonas rhizosphaerae]